MITRIHEGTLTGNYMIGILTGVLFSMLCSLVNLKKVIPKGVLSKGYEIKGRFCFLHPPKV